MLYFPSFFSVTWFFFEVRYHALFEKKYRQKENIIKNETLSRIFSVVAYTRLLVQVLLDFFRVSRACSFSRRKHSNVFFWILGCPHGHCIRHVHRLAYTTISWHVVHDCWLYLTWLNRVADVFRHHFNCVFLPPPQDGMFFLCCFFLNWEKLSIQSL